MITRSLTATFKHIWTDDPDIDTAHPACNKRQYELTHDPKHLPPKEGQRLAIFELAPLSRSQFQRVMQLRTQERPIDSCVLAVSYSLRSVSGFFDANGQEFEVKHITDGNGDRVVSPQSLDTIYDMALLSQLGTRAINESTLRPKNAQG